MKYIYSLILIVFSVCLFANIDYTFDKDLSPVPYGFSQWSEDNYGNHRAVVSVESPASLVLADIEWRRFDKEPQNKNIIVEGPNGPVNWTCGELNNLHGQVVFEAPVGGTYYIYYMPYISSGNYSIEKSDYFPYAPTYQGTFDINTLPKAKVEKIECRAEGRTYFNQKMDYDRDNFYSMYPMLITITDEELSDFKNKNATKNFLLFCEDRTNPIKMLHQIPYKWYNKGEILDFTGTAQPNEIYTFQIGVFANKDINDLKVTPSDFKGNKTIKSSDIHCINTGGIDYLGTPFKKVVSIKENDVQPLWFYMQFPKDAKGTYTGTVKISDGKKTTNANITINVDGDVLEDGGVSDSWRMSRISWLDSKLGIDENVIAPYVPLKVDNNKISILNRTVELSDYGFPIQVTSNNNNILAKPVDFGLYENDVKLDLKPVSKKVNKSTDATYDATYISKNDKLELTVNTVIEFDGACEFNVSVKALKKVDLSNVSLFVPYTKSVAKYGMGLAYRGGYAPESWDWKWDNKGGKFMMWLGDYDAGIQVKLEPKNHAYTTGATFDPALLPDGWYNDNNGDVKLKAESDYYSFIANSGEKTLKKGESCDFDFRFLVTPFKPFDENRFSYRASGAHLNTNLVFHGNRGNTFINYPFVEHEYLKNIIDTYKNAETLEDFSIEYNLKNASSDEGSVTMWVECKDDWDKHTIQSAICDVHMDEQIFQMYFPVDAKTIRTTSFNYKGDNMVGTAVHSFAQDASVPTESMKKGDKHVLTMAWSDNSHKIYLDGKEVFTHNARACKIPGKINSVEFSSQLFNIKAVRFDNNINLDTEIKAGDKTEVLDILTDNADPIVGEKGYMIGDGDISGEYLCSKYLGKGKVGVDIYYTARELSNKCQEIWALRSLGDEIYSRSSFVYTNEGAKEISNGGGYQWLNEQLQSEYAPAWHMKFQNGEHCAAIGTTYASRWLNFYVEGVNYMKTKLGIKGIYLDGIGYDRNIMKRMAKVLAYSNTPYDINFHCGNEYDYLDIHSSPMNTNMEHLAYITSSWMGEMFDYNRGPEYWFTEIMAVFSGVPSEMLENSNSNCNPYRGMIYGVGGRNMIHYSDLQRLWDSFHIEKATCIAYWDKNPVVKVNGSDEVLATAYKNEGKTLISIASWDNNNDLTVSLDVDFDRLGLDKNNIKIYCPKLSHFQDYKEFSSLDNIVVPKGKGYIFMLENK